MKETIKLVNKQRDVLVDVIQWLDEKNFSNTEIRSKVDHILNHSRKLHEESDMELTKRKLQAPSSKLQAPSATERPQLKNIIKMKGTENG